MKIGWSAECFRNGSRPVSNATIEVLRGRDDVAVVVPTRSTRARTFQRFCDSLRNVEKTLPTIVAVQSSGPSFNFATSVNLGIGEALTLPVKYIALANDDIQFLTPWIPLVTGVLTEDASCGFVAPLVLRPDGIIEGPIVPRPSWVEILAATAAFKILPPSVGIQIRELLWRVWTYQLARTSSLQRSPGSALVELNRGSMINIQPFCVARRETIAQVGPLDSQFRTGCEDLDYCLRLLRDGYSASLITSLRIVHEGSATLNVERAGNPVVLFKRDASNWARLLSKYTAPEYERLRSLGSEISRVT